MLELAEKDYLQCLVMQPQNINVMQFLASIQDKQGGPKLSESLKNFEKYFLKRIIDLNKEFSPAYNGKGLILDKLGKYEEAIRHFTKAIDLESENAIYWNNRACCFRNMGL